MDRDLALLNATVWSEGRMMGPRWGVLCRAGRIWQIGSEARLRALLTRDFDAYDLEGAFIFPGFIDSHLHLVSLGFALADVDLSEAASEDAAARAVGERVRGEAEGRWVSGRGWHSNEWPGGEYPTRRSLDSVTPPGVMVYLRSRCGHALWVNSAALAAAKVTRKTKDPAGGRVVRDPSGEPTGVLLERAIELVAKALPQRTLQEKVAAAQRAVSHLHAFGVTGAVVCGEADGMEATQALDSAGALRMRLLVMPDAGQVEHVAGLGLRPGFGSDFLGLGPVKVFADGSLGSRTAAMFSEYPDGTKGILAAEREEMEQVVRTANSAGWPVAIHAIGDRAVAEALGAIEAAGDPKVRNRIEHAQCVRRADAGRFKALGAIASVQPVHMVYDREAATKLWGEAAGRAFPLVTLKAAGATLAFGSDAPVVTADPMLGIHAAVNRSKPGSGDDPWLPDERLPVQDAVLAYTEGSAYAAGWEHRRGRLLPGFDADIVVLSENPFDVPREHLAELRPVATVVGGSVVHMAGD